MTDRQKDGHDWLKTQEIQILKFKSNIDIKIWVKKPSIEDIMVIF